MITLGYYLRNLRVKKWLRLWRSGIVFSFNWNSGSCNVLLQNFSMRAFSIFYVTASSGTALSTDFATLTCSEILSKILIRCVTWHWACDCSFRCFHEIGRYFDNKEQERAKIRARRHDRSQRRQERPKIDSFWGANTGFIDFQHYATLCSGNRKNESFRLKILVWCLEPLRPSFLAVWFAIFVPVFMFFQWF